MPRTRVVALVVVGMFLTTMACWAQVGTPNIPSATPWQGDDIELRGDYRVFEEDNDSWSFMIRGEMGEDADASIGIVDFETTGEDPVNGVVRHSDYQALVLDLKVLLMDGGPRVALRAGADAQTQDSRGVNTQTMMAAYLDDVVPAVSLPIEFGNPNSTLLIIEPKIVWFGTRMPVGSNYVMPSGQVMQGPNGPYIEGFGNPIMIGGALRHRLSGNIDVFADAAYPVSDSNSIDDVTNEVTEEIAWSAGASVDLGSSRNWTLDIFATTAAGPTPATSAIAAPDGSVGVGARLGWTW